jgi:crotonobetaine/carnitine-CoA ligase
MVKPALTDYPGDTDLAFGAVLDRRLARGRDKVFLLTPEGEFSLGALDDRATRLAHGLAGLGLARGDTLLVMLPNAVAAIEIWWALARLGVIQVPVNTAYRGSILRHVIRDSGAATMIVAGEYLDRLADIAGELDGLARLVLAETAPVPPSLAAGREILDLAALYREPPGALPPGPSERDLMAVMYTSGTTGPSKGVMVTHAHAYHYALAGVDLMALGPEDVYYAPLPLFHIAGQWNVTYAALIAGARVGLPFPFRPGRFWAEVAGYGATTTFLLGAMASLLQRQPPGPNDAETPLAKALIVPQLPEAAAFERRFGLRTTTTYGSTEANVPVKAHFDLADPRICGRARDELYELRIVDERDEEVPVGKAGELTIRAKRPWILMAGYWNHPEWTAQAWRNLWLHTGDSMMRDAAGKYYFVDRLKDAIRRKGENISSMEVENEILAHAAVLECAVFPVPAEGGEDEVMAVVVPKPGERIDPAALVAFLAPRLPHFMVPRYIEPADGLPKTPTGKIQKYPLRERGPGPETWDRERAGISLKSLVKKERTA